MNLLEYINNADVACAHNFNKAFHEEYNNINNKNIQQALFTYWLNTPLGPMLAVSDKEALYMLDFFDGRGIFDKLEKLKNKNKAYFISDMSEPIKRLKKELECYFVGKLKVFKTPVKLCGTAFQQLAWKALSTIPYGETRSYQEQALAIGHPKAHRAVANANGCNKMAIILPCHRIIRSDNTLGGYGGRVSRKEWLLALEQNSKG